MPPLLWRPFYRLAIVGGIPDAERYQPLYSPWLSPDFQALHREISPYTLASIDRCWTLHRMLAQALGVEGDVIECGVFRGGTARLIRLGMQGAKARTLFLFDSFSGMERVSVTVDRHQRGDFADTSLDGVRAFVGSDPFIDYRKGWIPTTFAGLEDRVFCFAHIDLDLYQSIIDTLEFLYPRMSRGGVMVFDDYGFPSCPGARRAVDEFFAARAEKPLALMTGQALVFKQ
jgi:O-methyltransferase